MKDSCGIKTEHGRKSPKVELCQTISKAFEMSKSFTSTLTGSRSFLRVHLQRKPAKLLLTFNLSGYSVKWETFNPYCHFTDTYFTMGSLKRNCNFV